MKAQEAKRVGRAGTWDMLGWVGLGYGVGSTGLPPKGAGPAGHGGVGSKYLWWYWLHLLRSSIVFCPAVGCSEQEVQGAGDPYFGAG